LPESINVNVFCYESAFAPDKLHLDEVVQTVPSKFFIYTFSQVVFYTIIRQLGSTPFINLQERGKKEKN